MSFEDLEAARAKRAAKEKAKATTGTGKRGRKRKNPEPDGETGPSEQRTRVVRMSRTPEPARAPVAKMI